MENYKMPSLNSTGKPSIPGPKLEKPQMEKPKLAGGKSEADNKVK